MMPAPCDVRLGELLECLIDYRGKTPRKATSGIKLITAKVIKGGRIEDDRHEFIDEAEYSSWMRRGLPQQGDILITTEGPLGEVAMLRSPERIALAQRVILLRAKARIADQNYLFHALRSPLVQARLQKRATGTTVLGIKQAELMAVEVPLPDLAAQRRIASVLSAYDDLIENNMRRIAILGETSRRIYEEWFVRLRFPTHGQVPFVQSEWGRMPQNWTIQRLHDIAELTYGFPFKSRLFNDREGARVIRIRDIKHGRTATFTSETADPRYRVLQGDILVGMDGDFHMGRWAGGDAWLNQRVVRLRPQRGVAHSWLFLAIQGPIERLEATIVGTTVAHLSARDLNELRLMVPSADLMERAAEILDPLFDLELALRQKNVNLRAARDLLLPRLVSGELEVSAVSELRSRRMPLTDDARTGSHGRGGPYSG